MTSESQSTINQKRLQMADLEDYAANTYGILTPGELLTLYYSEQLGYTAADIAGKFGKAPTTIRNQLITARNKMTELEEDQEYIDRLLEETDKMLDETDVFLTHDEVFESLRNELKKNAEL